MASIHLGVFNEAGFTNVPDDDLHHEYQLAAHLVPTWDPASQTYITNSQISTTGFEIVGNEDASPYDNWFKVEAYSYNVRSQSVIGGGAELVVYLEQSTATPRLIHACASQEKFKFMRLDSEIGDGTVRIHDIDPTTGQALTTYTDYTVKQTIAITMIEAVIVDYRGYTGVVPDGQGSASNNASGTANVVTSGTGTMNGQVDQFTIKFTKCQIGYWGNGTDGNVVQPRSRWTTGF